MRQVYAEVATPGTSTPAFLENKMRRRNRKPSMIMTQPSFKHYFQPDYNPRITISRPFVPVWARFSDIEGMLIPVWSVSKPNKKGECRIVFSWGKKNIANPSTMAGIAVFNGRRLTRMFIDGAAYRVKDLGKTKHSRKPFVIAVEASAEVPEMQVIEDQVLEVLIEKGVPKKWT